MSARTDAELLLHLMAEAQREVEQMPSWMKDQEPAPGQSYKEWMVAQETER